MSRWELGARLTRELGAMALAGSAAPDPTLDERLELAFRAGVAAAFPEDTVLGEELPAPRGWDGTGWVIDPLDGTSNFTGGLPLWCISVAYLESGEPTLGWVFDPLRDRLYRARLGHGAWRDDQHLAPGPLPAGKPLLALASRWRRAHPEQATRLASRVKDRTLGALALELAWVAEGTLQGGIWSGARSWDIAAGMLIARQAGCDLEWLEPEGDARRFQGPGEEVHRRRHELAVCHPALRSFLVPFF